MKQFFYEVKKWGWKIALSNQWLVWTWKLLGIKKINIVYKKKGGVQNG